MVAIGFPNLLLNRRSTLPFPGSQEQYEVCGSIRNQSSTDCSCGLDVYIMHRFVSLGVHPEFGEESVW